MACLLSAASRASHAFSALRSRGLGTLRFVSNPPQRLLCSRPRTQGWHMSRTPGQLVEAAAAQRAMFVRQMGSADNEPVGSKPVAGLLGAGGEDTVWPYILRLLWTFLGISLFAAMLSAFFLRRWENSGMHFELAKYQYRIQLKGKAAAMLYNITLRRSASLIRKGWYGHYDQISEDMKCLDLTVSCLLEVQSFGLAIKLLDQFNLCASQLLKLPESDWIRIVLFMRYGDVYSCTGQAKEAYENYSKALANAQKLADENPTRGNEALLGNIMEKAGRFELGQRNFEAACIFFEQALVQADKVLSGPDKQIINLLNSLVTAYDNCCRYDDGVLAGRRGLELARKNKSAVWEEAALHYNLAALYTHNRKLTDGRREVEQARALALKYSDDGILHWCSELDGELAALAEEQSAAQAKSSWW